MIPGRLFVLSVFLSFSVVPGAAMADNNAGGAFSTWPDTGQTTCYDADGNVLDQCPAVGDPFHGQDAQYQCPTRSYTSMGEGTMVRDNVTGLVWEVKESGDGAADYANPHDADNTYTWCDTDPDTNGGNQGSCDSNDTEDFIGALNSSAFGGYSDWRLPTLKELVTLVDYSRSNPAIDTSFFPGTVSFYYWSSTTVAMTNVTYFAWLVVFSSGGDGGFVKSNSLYVRAVRGGNTPVENRFVDNEDGTVTDTVTCLMWQQASMDSDNNGTPDTMTWQQALYESEHLTLAGYSDWRLPDINELHSIVDYSRGEPAIDTSFFPDTVSSYYYYWSSTSFAYYPSCAWHVAFSSGIGSYNSKFSSDYVRAVRGGQCRALGYFSWPMFLPAIIGGKQ